MEDFTTFTTKNLNCRQAKRDLSELLAEFSPLVKRLMSQYGSCPQLREELAGEIYHRFFTLVDVYDPSRGIPLKPYLVRQLTASIYTYVRSYRRSAARETVVDGIEYLPNGQVCDPTDDWDKKLMLEATGDALQEALSQISERQRSVIIWRYYHDYSFEQIAEELDVQTSTARSLLRHGLSRMKTVLAGQEAVLSQ